MKVGLQGGLGGIERNDTKLRSLRLAGWPVHALSRTVL